MKANRSAKRSAKGYTSPAATVTTASARNVSSGSGPSPASTKSSEPQSYSGEIELRLPAETMQGVQRIALLADVSVQTVIRVIMACEVQKHRTQR